MLEKRDASTGVASHARNKPVIVLPMATAGLGCWSRTGTRPGYAGTARTIYIAIAEMDEARACTGGQGGHSRNQRLSDRHNLRNRPRNVHTSLPTAEGFMMRFEGKPMYLACGVTDMRKSINGMYAIVEGSFKLDPFSNALFVFCNPKSRPPKNS